MPLSSDISPVTSAGEQSPERIAKRIVLHFPGFEPLDAKLHHARYARAAKQSAATWGLEVKVGDLGPNGSAGYFDVACASGMGRTESRVHIFDHAALVSMLTARPLITRVLSGYCSAARVALTGGLTGYFRHAWRFGLFFIFPFLLVALSILATIAIAALPFMAGLGVWHCLWSLPLAAAFFRCAVMPVSSRLHTLHLFADWDLAVDMATLGRPEVNRWLAQCVSEARKALADDADEYVISSHSMGSTVATHVIGQLLEEDPKIFEGKRVVFATLGGAILQCALLRSATRLREHVSRIARVPEIFWLEIQCLTDCVNFYKSRVVTLTGHADAPQAKIAFIRVKAMISADRYRRIKLDFLRIHRQYVLDCERRSNFDFTLMTAGPLPASRFVDFAPTDLHPAP
jgi:hypothetical protein